MKTWTTRTLLDWIESHLEARGVDGADLVARWLVAKAIGTDPIMLYTDLDRPASHDERDSLRALVQRASNHEPVQYLLGEAGFLGRIFAVGPGVLIPRTATETLIQHVVTWRGGQPEDLRQESLRILDIGTGSGCIAILLALQFPDAQVVAVDCSEDAIQYATRNVNSFGVQDQVHILSGDLCAPLAEDAMFDVIVSNPPYIPDGQWADVGINVRDFEPSIALRGGPDGRDVINRILEQAPSHLSEDGLLILEVDSSHAQEVCANVDSHAMLSDARVLKDEYRDDRFVAARGVTSG